jgi:hypothetical protein
VKAKRGWTFEFMSGGNSDDVAKLMQDVINLQTTALKLEDRIAGLEASFQNLAQWVGRLDRK